VGPADCTTDYPDAKQSMRAEKEIAQKSMAEASVFTSKEGREMHALGLYK